MVTVKKKKKRITLKESRKALGLPEELPPPQQTSEEDTREGQAIIRRREKLASQAGVSSKRAAEIINPQEQARIEAQKGEETEEIKRTEGEEFLQAKGFYEEKIPGMVELEEERTGAGKAPIIGPFFTAGVQIAKPRGLLGMPAVQKWLGIPKKQAETLIQNPETARELVLQKIQEEEVKKGTSTSEKVGAGIELIPIIGSKAGKYAGEMIESPSANVDTVLRDVKELRGTILKDYEATRAGLFDPYLAYDSIEESEELLYKLEQRIKNLSLESAELVADADKLNLIESKILRAKKVAYFAKQAAAIQLRGEPTDAKVEAWLMSELKLEEWLMSELN